MAVRYPLGFPVTVAIGRDEIESATCSYANPNRRGGISRLGPGRGWCRVRLLAGSPDRLWPCDFRRSGAGDQGPETTTSREGAEALWRRLAKSRRWSTGYRGSSPCMAVLVCVSICVSSNQIRQDSKTGPGLARFQPVFRVFWFSGTAPAGKTPQDSGRSKTARCGFCGWSPGEVLSRLTEACLALGRPPPGLRPDRLRARRCPRRSLPWRRSLGCPSPPASCEHGRGPHPLWPPPLHDSILLELPTALVEETRRIIVEAMERVLEGFSVPLRVDVKMGRTWAVAAHEKGM